MTDEEINLQLNGKDLYVFLELNDIAENNTDITLINQNTDKNSRNCLYFDMNLYKQIEGNDKVKISQLLNKIKISLQLPEEYINKDSSIVRKYYVMTVHNGVVSKIDAKLSGNILTFETDKFSTYAIGYTDSIIENNENTTIEADTENKENADTTENKVYDEKNNSNSSYKNPKTSDEIARNIILFITSVIGFAVVQYKLRK